MRACRWLWVLAVLTVAGTARAADEPLGFADQDDFELQHPRERTEYRPLPPPPEPPPQVAPTPEVIARPPDAEPKKAMFGMKKKEPSSQPSSQPASTSTNGWGYTEDKMVKGELSMLGMTEFLNPDNFAGVSLGYLSLDGVYYASVEPLLDLHFFDKRLHLDLGAALNFAIFDPNAGGFKALGRLRKQDWDEWQDYFKILRRLQYGRKEDHFYFRLSQVGAASLGHGGFMRRYNNNMFANSTHVGLELDAYNDYVGAEGFVSDITFQSRVLGGLAFFKPLSIFSSNAIARSFSIGGYYTGDLAAPLALKRDDQGVVLTDRAGNPQYTQTGLHGLGADVEVKPIRVGDTVDFKTYVDFNQFINYGNGFTGGGLLRINVPLTSLALRARAEIRLLGDEYLPSYFDNFYEIQKLQMVTVNPSTFAPTKLALMRGIHTGKYRGNGYGEVTLGWLEKLALTAAYDAGGGAYQQNFLLHFEFEAFDWLRLFVTYHKRSFDNWRDVFGFQQNDLLYGQVRIEVLPILFINGKIQRTFAWDPGVDLGLGGLQNLWEYQINLELGWQW